MFKLARGPREAQSCSGQRVRADQPVLWTVCSVDGWGKQRPPRPPSPGLSGIGVVPQVSGRRGAWPGPPVTEEPSSSVSGPGNPR